MPSIPPASRTGMLSFAKLFFLPLLLPYCKFGSSSPAPTSVDVLEHPDVNEVYNTELILTKTESAQDVKDDDNFYWAPSKESGRLIKEVAASGDISKLLQSGLLEGDVQNDLPNILSRWLDKKVVETEDQARESLHLGRPDFTQFPNDVAIMTPGPKLKSYFGKNVEEWINSLKPIKNVVFLYTLPQLLGMTALHSVLADVLRAGLAALRKDAVDDTTRIAIQTAAQFAASILNAELPVQRNFEWHPEEFGEEDIRGDENEMQALSEQAKGAVTDPKKMLQRATGFMSLAAGTFCRAGVTYVWPLDKNSLSLLRRFEIRGFTSKFVDFFGHECIPTKENRSSAEKIVEEALFDHLVKDLMSEKPDWVKTLSLWVPSYATLTAQQQNMWTTMPAFLAWIAATREGAIWKHTELHKRSFQIREVFCQLGALLEKIEDTPEEFGKVCSIDEMILPQSPAFQLWAIMDSSASLSLTSFHLAGRNLYSEISKAQMSLSSDLEKMMAALERLRMLAKQAQRLSLHLSFLAAEGQKLSDAWIQSEKTVFKYGLDLISNMKDFELERTAVTRLLPESATAKKLADAIGEVGSEHAMAADQGLGHLRDYYRSAAEHGSALLGQTGGQGEQLREVMAYSAAVADRQNIGDASTDEHITIILENGKNAERAQAETVKKSEQDQQDRVEKVKALWHLLLEAELAPKAKEINQDIQKLRKVSEDDPTIETIASNAQEHTDEWDNEGPGKKILEMTMTLGERRQKFSEEEAQLAGHVQMGQVFEGVQTYLTLLDQNIEEVESFIKDRQEQLMTKVCLQEKWPPHRHWNLQGDRIKDLKAQRQEFERAWQDAFITWIGTLTAFQQPLLKRIRRLSESLQQQLKDQDFNAKTTDANIKTACTESRNQRANVSMFGRTPDFEKSVHEYQQVCNAIDDLCRDSLDPQSINNVVLDQLHQLYREIILQSPEALSSQPETIRQAIAKFDTLEKGDEFDNFVQEILKITHQWKSDWDTVGKQLKPWLERETSSNNGVKDTCRRMSELQAGHSALSALKGEYLERKSTQGYRQEILAAIEESNPVYQLGLKGVDVSLDFLAQQISLSEKSLQETGQQIVQNLEAELTHQKDVTSSLLQKEASSVIIEMSRIATLSPYQKYLQAARELLTSCEHHLPGELVDHLRGLEGKVQQTLADMRRETSARAMQALEDIDKTVNKKGSFEEHLEKALEQILAIIQACNDVKHPDWSEYIRPIQTRAEEIKTRLLNTLETFTNADVKADKVLSQVIALTPKILEGLTDRPSFQDYLEDLREYAATKMELDKYLKAVSELQQQSLESESQNKLSQARYIGERLKMCVERRRAILIGTQRPSNRYEKRDLDYEMSQILVPTHEFAIGDHFLNKDLAWSSIIVKKANHGQYNAVCSPR